jgi:DNA-binding NarL/FixJ family response regulator
MIRIAVLEEECFMRDNLMELLHDHPDIEVTGDSESSEAFFEALDANGANVAIIGVNTEADYDCMDVIRRLHSEYPDVKIIAWADLGAGQIVDALWGEGIRGSIGKAMVTDVEAENAILEVAAGGYYFGAVGNAPKRPDFFDNKDFIDALRQGWKEMNISEEGVRNKDKKSIDELKELMLMNMYPFMKSG